MSEQILTNAFLVVALATVAWFLLKKWMDSIDQKFAAILGKITELCTANSEQHEEIWNRINKHGHRIKPCQTNGGGFETAGVIVEGP